MKLLITRKKLNTNGDKSYLATVSFELDNYPKENSENIETAILFELFETLLSVANNERVLVEFSLNRPLKGITPIKFVIQKTRLKNPCMKNVLTKRKKIR